MSVLNPAQLDYVTDIQDEQAEYGEMSAGAVATALAAQGHPLFEGYGVAEPDPTAGASAPVVIPEAREVGYHPPTAIPDLDTGPPKTETATVTPEEAKLLESMDVVIRKDRDAEEPQLPARAAPQGDPVEGMEDLDAQDFLIPSLQIKQAQTKDKHETGIREVDEGHLFLTNDPPGHSAAKTLVFVAIKPGRSYMLPYEDPEERDEVLHRLHLTDKVPDESKVVCESHDRRLPSAKEWGALAESCEECPHSKWRKTRQGRMPPHCGEVYRATVLDITDGGATPARLLLKSSAITATKSLMTNLSLSARRFGLPMFGFGVEVSTKAKEGKKGNYHVPVFGRPKRVGAEDVEMYRTMRQGLMGQ